MNEDELIGEIKTTDPTNLSIRLCIEATWLMDLYKENDEYKIRFNTEEFPDLGYNDFANEVMGVLERSGHLNYFIWKEVEERMKNG